MIKLDSVKKHIENEYNKSNITDEDNLQNVLIGGGLANRGKTSNDIDLIAEIDEGILDKKNSSEKIINIIEHLQKVFPEKMSFDNETLKVDIQFFVLSGDYGVSQYGKVHEDKTISRSTEPYEISNKQKETVELF